MKATLSFGFLVIWRISFLLHGISTQDGSLSSHIIHQYHEGSDLERKGSVIAATPAPDKLPKSSSPLGDSEVGSIKPESVNVEGTTIVNYGEVSNGLETGVPNYIKDVESTMDSSRRIESNKTPEIQSSMNNIEEHKNVDVVEDYFVADYGNMEYYYEDFLPDDIKREGVDMIQFLENFLGESENTEIEDVNKQSEEQMHEMVKQQYSQEQQIKLNEEPEMNQSTKEKTTIEQVTADSHLNFEHSQLILEQVPDDTLSNHEQVLEASLFNPEKIPDDSQLNHKQDPVVEAFNHKRVMENLLFSPVQSSEDSQLTHEQGPEDSLFTPVSADSQLNLEEVLKSSPVIKGKNLETFQPLLDDTKSLKQNVKQMCIKSEEIVEMKLFEHANAYNELIPRVLEQKFEQVPYDSQLNLENLKQVPEYSLQTLDDASQLNLAQVPDISQSFLEEDLHRSLEDASESSSLNQELIKEQVLDNSENVLEQVVKDPETDFPQQNQELETDFPRQCQELETELQYSNPEPVTEVEKLNHTAQPVAEFLQANLEIECEGQHQNLELEPLKEIQQLNVELESEVQQPNIEIKTITEVIQSNLKVQLPELLQSNRESDLQQPNLESELQQSNLESQLSGIKKSNQKSELQQPYLELESIVQQPDLEPIVQQPNRELELMVQEPNLKLETMVQQPNLKLESMIQQLNPELETVVQQSNLELESMVQQPNLELELVAQQTNLELVSVPLQPKLKLESEFQLPILELETSIIEPKLIRIVEDRVEIEASNIELKTETEQINIEESEISQQIAVSDFMRLSIENRSTINYIETFPEVVQLIRKPVAEDQTSSIELVSIEQDIYSRQSYFSEEEPNVSQSSFDEAIQSNLEQLKPEVSLSGIPLSDVQLGLMMEALQSDLDGFTNENAYNVVSANLEQLTIETSGEYLPDGASDKITSFIDVRPSNDLKPEWLSLDVQNIQEDTDDKYMNKIVSEQTFENGMVVPNSAKEISYKEQGENQQQEKTVKEVTVNMKENYGAKFKKHSSQSLMSSDEIGDNTIDSVPDDGVIMDENEYVEWLLQFVPSSLYSWSHGLSYSITVGDVSGDRVLLLVIVAVSFLSIFAVNQFLGMFSRERLLIAKIAEMDKKLFSAKNELLWIKKSNSDNLDNVDVIPLMDSTTIDEVQEMEKQLKEAHRAFEQGQAERQEAKLEYEKEHQDVQQLRSRCEELVQELDKVSKECVDAVEKSKKAEEMMDEVLAINNDKDNQDSQEKLVELVRQLQEQLEGQKTLLFKYEPILKMKEREVKELRKETKQLKKKVADADLEVVKARKELVESKDRITNHLETRAKHKSVQTQLNEKNAAIENKEAQHITMKNRLLIFDNEDKSKEGSIEELKEMIMILLDSTANKNLEGDSWDSNVTDIKEMAKLRLQERKGIEERLQKKIADMTAKLTQVELELSKVTEESKCIGVNWNQAAKDEAVAKRKLDVLAEFFNKKETELQKQSTLQSDRFDHDLIGSESIYRKFVSVTKELEATKGTLKLVRGELEETETSKKASIAEHERKSYENWVAARQAERNLSNVQGEMTLLRNRMTMVEDKNRDLEKQIKTKSMGQNAKLEPVNDNRFDTDSQTGTKFQPIEKDLPPLPGLPEFSGPSHLPPLPGSLLLPKMMIPSMIPPDLIDARLPPLNRSQTSRKFYSHRSPSPYSRLDTRRYSSSPSQYRPGSRSSSRYMPESCSPSRYSHESRSPSKDRPESSSTRHRPESSSSLYRTELSSPPRDRPQSSSSRYKQYTTSQKLGVGDTSPSQHRGCRKTSEPSTHPSSKPKDDGFSYNGDNSNLERIMVNDVRNSSYRDGDRISKEDIDLSHSERELNDEVFYDEDNGAWEERSSVSNEKCLLQGW